MAEFKQNDSCSISMNSGSIYEWTYGNSGWSWAKSPQSYSLSPGTNTIQIIMREDGAKIDKIILTTDAGYTPSGTGPSETL